MTVFVHTYVYLISEEVSRKFDLLELDLQTVVSLQCGCWELNPDSLEEQPVLLTTKPFLQAPKL